MCLLRYVPGVTPPDWPRWSPQTLRALGAFLAEVHATPPPPDLPRDDLALPQPQLSDVDHQLAEAITAQLARLRGLRAAFDASPAEMVLCHTDPAGDNIIVDAEGHLTVLDWDEAAICFPEADFVLIARDQPPSGEPLRLVLQGYRAHREFEPHPDRLAFLMLRRYLGDALARADRLLDPASTDAERRAAREGITEWGVRQWNRLDEALTLAWDRPRV